jgi:hypothetical protein
MELEKLIQRLDVESKNLNYELNIWNEKNKSRD